MPKGLEFRRVLFRALEGHGDRRRGDLEPMGKGGGNDLIPFRLSLENGLQIVFFGYVDGVFHRGTGFSLIGRGVSAARGSSALHLQAAEEGTSGQSPGLNRLRKKA